LIHAVATGLHPVVHEPGVVASERSKGSAVDKHAALH
jgi:hypothetical protein